MCQLFFEIIRVAIGTQPCLSRLPSTNEWNIIFELANKQSLVGITFIALQRMGADADEGYTRIGMSEVCYLTWMGMAARIQLTNDNVNQYSVEIQRRLSVDGYACCILKGQGVSAYYGALSEFRHSGDIDVWVPGGYKDTIKYLAGLGVLGKVTANHAEVHIFEETDVEVHPIPAIFRCPWTNRRWSRFCKEHQGDWQQRNGLTVPSVEFNLVFLMVHMYQHLLREGIGLRQMMDYFFVIKAQEVQGSMLKVQRTIESLGMKRFAAGVMYIMQKVFGLAEEMLICEADPEAGETLLSEVMTGGNFGHYDKRNEVAFDNNSNPLLRVWNSQKRNMRFIEFGYWEIVCSPLWRLWHFCWMKAHGYR